MRTSRALAGALATLALTAGCAKSPDTSGTAVAKPTQSASSSTTPISPPTTSDPGNFPTPEPSDLTPTTEETSDFTEVKFGETGSFTQDNDNTFEVTVQKPTKAKCQYAAIGCDRPQTGDRVVTAKVTVKNTGSQAIEIQASSFVLEFADGTRMEPGDGAATDYSPDNQMEYDHRIRPKGTYTSTLTFEAPNGAYSIIMLSGGFDSEDLYGWK